MGRISQLEMEKSIFRPKIGEQESPEPEPVARRDTYYTIFGKHDEIEDGNPVLNKYDERKVFAHRRILKKKTVYFIMFDPSGNIYNPLSMYEASFLRKQKIGPTNKLGAVPERVFRLYLNFLRTKNKSWLTHAQRELV